MGSEGMVDIPSRRFGRAYVDEEEVGTILVGILITNSNII